MVGRINENGLSKLDINMGQKQYVLVQRRSSFIISSSRRNDRWQPRAQ